MSDILLNLKDMNCNGTDYSEWSAGDHPTYYEPELYGTVPVSPLDVKKDISCTACKVIVHTAASEEANMLWVANGKGNHCLKCFYESTKDISPHTETTALLDWAQ